MSNTKILTYTFGIIILFFAYSSFFTVDQTKQAIVLQFGEPKRVVNKPGLNFKIPFIQDVTYFEKRVLSLVSSDSEEVILSDQKRLEVDTYSRFKIIDPLLFYQTVRNETGARQRLESIIDSSVRRVLGKLELVSILSDARQNIVDDIGIFSPKKISKKELSAGEVGYLVAGIKDIKGAPVGDTLIDFNDETTNALPGFKKVNPKVFASLFTLNSDDYEKFRDALSKLVLNDSSLIYEPEVSDALGFGFRCGFLGTLHMEVVRERLEREYDLDLISTAPSVEYEVLKTDGEILKCDNPSQLPTPNEIDEIREPIVNITIISPNEYVGNIITLCTSKRGTQKDMKYFGNQVSIMFEMPLSSVIIDFFDQIKSSTKGFASIEYSLLGFQKSDLTKIDVLINNNKIDALSMIVHKSFSTSKAREIAKNLQKLIPRQMFDVPIQVALGAKIISRETVKAYRKNVTAKLYGGDVTRKMKLLEKQKQGKKKMKQLGKVSIPQDAFLNYFNSEQ